MLHFVFVDLYVDGYIPVLYSQSFRVLSKFDYISWLIATPYWPQLPFFLSSIILSVLLYVLAYVSVSITE